MPIAFLILAGVCLGRLILPANAGGKNSDGRSILPAKSGNGGVVDSSIDHHLPRGVPSSTPVGRGVRKPKAVAAPVAIPDPEPTPAITPEPEVIPEPEIVHEIQPPAKPE